LVNTDELEYALFKAERRVLEIQTKLHCWAREDSHRRFDDLFNLVADPAFLLTAWARVRGNKGARTPGVDGCGVHYVVCVGSRFSSANYGPASRIGVSARCRCGNG
jgi:RNA-directed DNA polymerase